MTASGVCLLGIEDMSSTCPLHVLYMSGEVLASNWRRRGGELPIRAESKEAFLPNDVCKDEALMCDG